MDYEYIRRMAQEASALCRVEFKDIEKGVPKCFRSNPGGKMTPARKKRLLTYIEKIEQIRL